MPCASGHPQSPNPNSIRVSKTVNGVEHQYYLSGSQIIAETWGTQMLVYLYDAEGSPIGMLYRTTSYAEGVFDTYWFEKNLQGDIVAIYNASGTKLVSYTYDAWGNCTKIFGSHATAELNPFRYRGYYYDTETGLYYLQSRYYDPVTGRFLNPDTFPSTGQGLIGNNMYAYCNNNPVFFKDDSGEIPIAAIIAAVYLFTPVGGVAFQTSVSITSYAGMAVTSIWDEGVRSDMEAIGWNPFNDDETKVTGSQKVSFYKGVPVYKVSNMGGSMSLGAIFYDASQGNDTLMHERGHSTQMMSMGLGNYLTHVGIPSVWKNDDNNPWELSASVLGNSGLANNASSAEIKEAERYCHRIFVPGLNMVNIYKYIFEY